MSIPPPSRARNQCWRHQIRSPWRPRWRAEPCLWCPLPALHVSVAYGVPPPSWASLQGASTSDIIWAFCESAVLGSEMHGSSLLLTGSWYWQMLMWRDDIVSIEFELASLKILLSDAVL